MSKLTDLVGKTIHIIADVITNHDGSVAEHAVLPLTVTSADDETGTVSGHVLPNGPGESTFVSGVTVHDSADDALAAYVSPEHKIDQANRHAILSQDESVTAVSGVTMESVHSAIATALDEHEASLHPAPEQTSDTNTAEEGQSA